MRVRLRLDRLHELIASSRLSQNHWALKVGVSKGHWSEIVNGKHPYPSPRTRSRMVEEFGVALEELFEIEPAPAGPWPDTEFRMLLSDRYGITQELGQGAMGVVYHGTDRKHGRAVAIKALSPEAVSGIGVTHFLKEIATIARLHHPHILPLYDSGEAAGSPYYVMPLVRGGSLRGRLERQGRLSLAETLAVCRGIASALDHTHAHQVLHCDIKPENVLLDGNHAWVMDFGIARAIHREVMEWGRPRTLDLSAGTPAYMSPEQARGDQDLDGRSDVFSLACVVYEMVSGKAPFEGRTTQAIVARRFLGPAPDLREAAPELPAAVAEVVSRAMSLQRNHRPATAAAFIDELERAARLPGRTLSFPPAVLRLGARVQARVAAPLAEDLRYAMRQAKRFPGFTALVLLTFALGIGATTAMFTLVERVLLRPLPFPEPDRLVVLTSVDSLGSDVPVVSAGNWLDWRAQSRLLGATGIAQSTRTTVAADGPAQKREATFVGGAWLQAVHPRLAAGRLFTEAEADSRAPVAVVSERLWRELLGADSALGRAIRLNGRPHQVVGVVAAGQEYPRESDIWAPGFVPTQRGGARNNINYEAIARLADGATIASARAELDAIAARIRAEDPVALYSWGVHVRPLRDWIIGDAGQYLRLLLASVGCVLLIACANLAGASLSRAGGRGQEMAVRVALGARRGRLVIQLLREHVLLALAGGALGVALAWVAVRLVLRWGGHEIPRSGEVELDGTVLAFSTVLSLLAGALTGLLPALRASTVAPRAVLSGGGGTVRGARRLPGAWLVGAELGGALVLLVAAGLLVRSFRQLLARDLGFETRNVIAAEVTLLGLRYRQEPGRAVAYWSALLDDLATVPGVEAVGAANWIPLGTGGTGFIEVAGREFPGAGAGYRVVSDGYFRALEIPLVAGRVFSSEDARETPRVVVINHTMAERYWPDQDPIGRRVRAVSQEQQRDGPAPWLTVVGVVGDIRHWGLEAQVQPEMYVLYRQVPGWVLAMSAVVRAQGSAERLIPVIRGRVLAHDPDEPAAISTLEQRLSARLAPRRLVMWLLTAFGALASILALVGVWSMLSYAVAGRAREIALRAALGATSVGLVSMVLRGALAVLAAGAAIGLAAAFGVTRLMRSLLVGVSFTDPVAMAGAALILLLGGLAAATPPALRAARVDPMRTLKSE